MTTYEEVVDSFFGFPGRGIPAAVEYTHRVITKGVPRSQVSVIFKRALNRAHSTRDTELAVQQCTVLLDEAGIGLAGLENYAKSELDPIRLLKSTRTTESQYDALRLRDSRNVYRLINPGWQQPKHIRRVMPEDREPEVTAHELSTVANKYAHQVISRPGNDYRTDDVRTDLEATGYSEQSLIAMAMAELQPSAYTQFVKDENYQRIYALAGSVTAARLLCRSMYDLQQEE